MRNLLLSAVVTLIAAELALGQLPDGAGPTLPPKGTTPLPPRPVVSVPDELTAPATELFVDEVAQERQLWVNADYLLWWIKDGPFRLPLVTTTTNSSLSAQSGLIGQQGTKVLFGDTDLDYGAFAGGRVMLGCWLDAQQRFGVEGGGFLLEQRSVRLVAVSDGAGMPILALSYQTPEGRETANMAAAPAIGMEGPLVGGIVVTSSSSLEGAEANGLINLLRSGALSTKLLAGIRYVSLREDMQIVSSSVAGSAATYGTLSSVQTDHFDTRNQFAGGQMGSRVGYSLGRLTMDLTGRIALGSTRQVVSVAGNSVFNTTGALAGILPASTDGGTYAQPSNSGRSIRNEFSVIPEMQIKVGVDLTSWVRTSVGYNFLYWSSVVRPGDQIDRVVNPSQSIALGGNGVLTGPARPTTLFNQSELWAQGVNFSLELGW